MTTLHGVDMEVALDVSAQVQDWVNEPDSNYGLMLKADDILVQDKNPRF
jgi:hypothetical protein